MADRPLTERQERALLAVAQGRASSYSNRSCPSLALVIGSVLAVIAR